MATKGSEYRKNPIWKENLIGNLKDKVIEVKLEYQNLTNELLKKSGISAKDMSEGMRQLEEMMETIFSLQYQIQEEEISSQNDGWKESYNLPGDESASVQTQDNGKEKQESPTMMNGRMVTTCPKDGGAGDGRASVQTQ